MSEAMKRVERRHFECICGHKFHEKDSVNVVKYNGNCCVGCPKCKGTKLKEVGRDGE